MNIKNIFIIFSILTISGCSFKNSPKIEKPQGHSICNLSKKSTNSCQKHTLVVFVHGTILPLPSPTCIFSALKNSLKRSRRDHKSWSDYYYERLRYRTFFKCQPIGDMGLVKIDAIDHKRYPYTKQATSLYENCYNFVNQEKTSELNFYTFGWDGRLSHKSRVKSARAFYMQLETEIENLKRQLKINNLEIVLIGHSHGGNVLLNLAKAEEEFKHNLKVDKLILLGTPVQSETSELIHSPIFKKIYNFYSNGDYIQVIDMLSTQDDISKRRYKNDAHKSNLVQIELKVGNKKPLHNELWLFGGESNFIYREGLAVYPMPVFVFIPAIIGKIEENKNTCEILAQIDKNKNTQVFTVKINNKQGKPEFEASIPEKIFALA